MKSAASWLGGTLRQGPTLAIGLSLALMAPGEPAHAQTLELDGVVDLHVHADPDSRGPRSVSAIEAAQLARRHGMRALLIKNHFTETASQAYLASQVVDGIQLYGGIVLNLPVGGINTAAVDNMARIAGGFGRVVWLPTFHSENNAPDSENVPVTRNGELLPEVVRVFEVMGEHDLALATGHIRAEESLLAIRRARALGIERIVVTHPSSGLVGMSVEQQREAAGLGALLEYTIMSMLDDEGFEREAARIRAVGPQNVVLTSDLGQMGNPVHADGMRMILPRLEAAGFTRAEIELMTKRNPARLLDLD